jgi:hypothetical protein
MIYNPVGCLATVVSIQAGKNKGSVAMDDGLPASYRTGAILLQLDRCPSVGAILAPELLEALDSVAMVTALHQV